MGSVSKTLKGELIREVKRHKEDFIITDGGGSRWTASGTDGCIARVNFPAPALVSHIATEDETFDKVLALAGESLDDFRVAPLPETDRRLPRQSRGCIAEAHGDSAD